VHNELAVLKHMLRRGRRLGYLDVVPDIDMPTVPTGRTRYLDADELARLLAACGESRNRYLPAIVVIAIHTGMRKGEILGLTWERVNVSTSTIALYKTKSGKPRGVPINGEVYDALVGIEPVAARRRGYVFKGVRGKEQWGQIRTAWENAVERAGIKDFRFHDLRHTAASYLVMRGASPVDVKDILGHSDIKTTMKYAHLSPSHLRAAVGRLEGLTSGATRPSTAAAPDADGHTNGHTAVESLASGS